MTGTLVTLALVVAVAGLAGYCQRSLRRQALGRECHAHADGTVHEHHRGSVPHTHPTFTDRHERLTGRLFGSAAR